MEKFENNNDCKCKIEIKDKSESNQLAITYQDDYSGAISFLESPITENFLTDIKEQLRTEFEKSFRNLKDYDFLENEIKKSTNPTQKGKIKEKEKNNNLKSAVLERLSTMFLPEFLNRLDDIIVFQPLRPEELRKICDLMIKDVTERVKLRQINLFVEDKVKTKLTREGYNPSFGARPLRRLVTKYIEDLISEDILNNTNTKKSRIVNIKLNEADQIIVEK
jgi:ATP-dependent Clp protease ATP-binding subunit ClpA